MACDQPPGSFPTYADCDDADPARNPDAAEICDDLDNDCDGEIDVDATDEQIWYADGDGDGYGGTAPVTECDAPEGYLGTSTDCDDADGSVHPDAAEVWYDGVDQACEGGSDYDGDGDGDDSDLYGGGDCDDADPDRYTRMDCRADCTRPSPEILTSSDPDGVSDIAFDGACIAWVSTIISGPDYVYGIDNTGATTVITGAGVADIGALAVDPVSGDLAVSMTSDAGEAYLGIESSGAFAVVATGASPRSTSWANLYLNKSAASLAWDSDGCIWFPNWDVSGTIGCLTTAGSFTSVATFSAYVESVALDADEALYVAEGATVWQVDPATGASTEVYTFANTVLDIVIDYQGDLYVETTGDEVRLLEAGATTDMLFASVVGDGKLAIAPDGYVVRASLNPVSSATYEEWAVWTR